MPVDQITTNRVATEAGVSIGGLYRFFPDKQAIVDAVAVRHVDDFQRLVEQRLGGLEGLDGPKLLELMIDTYVEFLNERPAFRAIALGRHVSALTREQQFTAGPASLVKMFLADSDFDWKLRVTIEAGERLIDFAFAQPSAEARDAVIREMKRMLSGYLFGPDGGSADS
jgi:AcrR family transcriptional regulator